MKPTVGRIVHVYIKVNANVERGPIAGIVVDITRIGLLMRVRIFEPGVQDYEFNIVSLPDTSHTRSDGTVYRWCWPPKETE